MQAFSYQRTVPHGNVCWVRHKTYGDLPIILNPYTACWGVSFYVSNASFVEKIFGIQEFIVSVTSTYGYSRLGAFRYFFNTTPHPFEPSILNNEELCNRFPPLRDDQDWLGAFKTLIQIPGTDYKRLNLHLIFGMESIIPVMRVLDDTITGYRLIVVCSLEAMEAYQQSQPVIFPKAVIGLTLRVIGSSQEKRVELLRLVCDTQMYRDCTDYLTIDIHDQGRTVIGDLKFKLSWQNINFGYWMKVDGYTHFLNVMDDPHLPLILMLCTPFTSTRFRQILPKDCVRMIAEKLMLKCIW